MLTSNRPVDEWGKLLGDTAAVTALLGNISITVTFNGGYSYSESVPLVW
jgi:hypothetical protein